MPGQKTLYIRYFAQLAEALGCREECLDSDAATTGELLDELRARGTPWSSELARQPLLIAVNQVMAHADTPLQADDEVAFMPPVSGG
jgi:molybdopterin synthase sulfur carrier subunit